MLPYATVEEASAALGRPLTAAETLWFDYSATKSDFFLYCHSVLFICVIFTFVPPLYLLVGHLSSLLVNNKIKIDEYKIQPMVKLSLSENFRGYSDVMGLFLLVVGPLHLLSYPSVKMIGIRTSLPLPSLGEVLAHLVVYFIIEDYAYYWLHRFLHCKWAYEKIHSVHHEYTAPMGYVSLYTNWAEVPIVGIASILGPAMVPGHMITFWLWVSLRLIEGIESHCGYDFPWTPTKWIPFYGGAEYHDYHHYVGGQGHSNFASVFTYCDYIYGTDKGYRYRKKVLKEKDGVKSTSLQHGGSYNPNIDYKSD